MVISEEFKENKIQKIYTIDVDDIKNIVVENGVVVEIKKKRKGKYGNRGKQGSRYYGRETMVQTFE